jgi:hypothetical protein
MRQTFPFADARYFSSVFQILVVRIGPTRNLMVTKMPSRTKITKTKTQSLLCSEAPCSAAHFSRPR